MTLRFLVNFGLLALPIGITLGILFGLQAHNIEIGVPPPFAPSNKIANDRYCQKAFGIHPESKGQEYTCMYKPPSLSHINLLQCLVFFLLPHHHHTWPFFVFPFPMSTMHDAVSCLYLLPPPTL